MTNSSPLRSWAPELYTGLGHNLEYWEDVHQALSREEQMLEEFPDECTSESDDSECGATADGETAGIDASIKRMFDATSRTINNSNPNSDIYSPTKLGRPVYRASSKLAPERYGIFHKNTFSVDALNYPPFFGINYRPFDPDTMAKNSSRELADSNTKKPVENNQGSGKTAVSARRVTRGLVKQQLAETEQAKAALRRVTRSATTSSKAATLKQTQQKSGVRAKKRRNSTPKTKDEEERSAVRALESGAATWEKMQNGQAVIAFVLLESKRRK